MNIDWAIVLPPLSVIGSVLLIWWRLDSKVEGLDNKIAGLDNKITGLDQKIEGVREASETAHRSIRDDLCDLKVITATIKTDVEWLKSDRQQ